MLQKQYLIPQNSCFISANAGSGKTKVIIDRILALLLSGVKSKDILAITFTTAAAMEMKDRVISLIGRVFQYTGEELQSYLVEFLSKEITNEDLKKYQGLIVEIERDIGELKIQTIHSFCQSLLQEFTLEAGLKPGFKIVDENYSEVILSEAKEVVFGNQAISEILESLMSNYHYNFIAEILNEISSERTKISYILSEYDSYSQYVDNIYSFLKIPNDKNYKEQVIREFLNGVEQSFLEQIKMAIESCGLKSDIAKIPALELLLNGDTETSLLDFQNFFCQKKNKDFLKNVITKNVREKVSNYDEIIARIIKEYENVFEIIKKCNLAEISVDTILVAQVFLEAYEQIKLQRNLVDYEDLILKSLILLRDKTYRNFILYKLDCSFNHLLIDEAQDVSPWQWEIVRLLLEEFFATDMMQKSFFIVGDEKQSIYSFQGADHQLFNDIKEEFSAKVNVQHNKLHEVNLTTSYRSTTPVLNFVDNISAKKEVKTALVSNIDGDINHKCFRKNAKGQVVIWPEIIPQKKSETMEPWSFPKDIVRKVSAQDEIAQRIISFIEKKLQNKDVLSVTGKVIKAGDILILCRKRDTLYDAIIRAADGANLAIESDKRVSILDYVLIMDFVALLKFTLFPQDSLNLAALLKSPLFHLSEDDLFDLCHNREKKDLWGILEASEKYSRIYNSLCKIKDLIEFLDIEEFYLYLIEKYNLRQEYYKSYGKKAEILINQFLQVIQSFIEYDDGYENFLEYILSCNIAVKNEVSGNENAVKILTIHGSKGLQSPITILTIEDYSMSSFRKSSFFFDNENHIIFSNFTTIPKELADCFDKPKQKQFSEELRLLYVALTRAQDELHIFALKNRNNENSWFGLLENTASGMSEFRRESDGSLQYSVVPVENYISHVVKKHNIAPLYNPNIVVNQTKNCEEVITSMLGVNNKDYMKLGDIYHELFSFLSGKFSKDTVKTDIVKYIKSYFADAHKIDVQKIVSKMVNIYNDKRFYDLFFARNGFSELQLISKNNGKILSGRIDRLAIFEDHVHIIDYKLSYNPSKLSDYEAQLLLYEKLVEANFSNKKIKKSLFYIEEENLVEQSP